MLTTARLSALSITITARTLNRLTESLSAASGVITVLTALCIGWRVTARLRELARVV